MSDLSAFDELVTVLDLGPDTNRRLRTLAETMGLPRQRVAVALIEIGLRHRLEDTQQQPAPRRWSDLDPDDLVTPREAALRICVGVGTLAKWRVSGKGPPFLKRNRRCVLYYKRDVDTFLETDLKRSTSEY